MPVITQEYLKELIHYNPETGHFTWRQSRGRVAKGQRAGYYGTEGYRLIRVNNFCYREARLAFLYMTGSWPKYWMDHLNRIRDDNRWDNLCDSTPTENNINNSSTNVSLSNRSLRKKWRARVQKNGKEKHLGYFATQAEAKAVASAYKQLGV